MSTSSTITPRQGHPGTPRLVGAAAGQGLGIGSKRQRLPFHRSASRRVPAGPAGLRPTAMHLDALVHETSLSPPPGPGVGSLRQRIPFQNSATLSPSYRRPVL